MNSIDSMVKKEPKQEYNGPNNRFPPICGPSRLQIIYQPDQTEMPKTNISGEIRLAKITLLLIYYLHYLNNIFTIFLFLYIYIYIYFILNIYLIIIFINLFIYLIIFI